MIIVSAERGKLTQGQR